MKKGESIRITQKQVRRFQQCSCWTEHVVSSKMLSSKINFDQSNCWNIVHSA